MAQEIEIHDMRSECRKVFEQIYDRLDKGDDSFQKHSDAIHRTDIELAELRRARSLKQEVWITALSGRS